MAGREAGWRTSGATKGWASFHCMPAMCAKCDEAVNTPPSGIDRKRRKQQGYNPKPIVGNRTARAPAGIDDVGNRNERPGNEDRNGKYVGTAWLSTGPGCIQRLAQHFGHNQKHPDE